MNRLLGPIRDKGGILCASAYVGVSLSAALLPPTPTDLILSTQAAPLTCECVQVKQCFFSTVVLFALGKVARAGKCQKIHSLLPACYVSQRLLPSLSSTAHCGKLFVGKKTEGHG